MLLEGRSGIIAVTQEGPVPSSYVKFHHYHSCMIPYGLHWSGCCDRCSVLSTAETALTVVNNFQARRLA